MLQKLTHNLLKVGLITGLICLLFFLIDFFSSTELTWDNINLYFFLPLCAVVGQFLVNSYKISKKSNQIKTSDDIAMILIASIPFILYGLSQGNQLMDAFIKVAPVYLGTIIGGFLHREAITIR
ncbi:hypothetical protein [Fundicoccus culcitae]|uniref:EamA domain-containing protein n=1 Tax=Fundicoccus culcitae TaxID=2969821 RepID=A0ABY5P9X5_9LACT|nr:hypothetical protein [Fundicoccus culcitae]UUX35160.1 hypothetical protein NRE15_05830 [Fundicoccus culcitae]